jgi:hypothetical protein
MGGDFNTVIDGDLTVKYALGTENKSVKKLKNRLKKPLQKKQR